MSAANPTREVSPTKSENLVELRSSKVSEPKVLMWEPGPPFSKKQEIKDEA